MGLGRRVEGAATVAAASDDGAAALDALTLRRTRTEGRVGALPPVLLVATTWNRPIMKMYKVRRENGVFGVKTLCHPSSAVPSLHDET